MKLLVDVPDEVLELFRIKVNKALTNCGLEDSLYDSIHTEEFLSGIESIIVGLVSDW